MRIIEGLLQLEPNIRVAIIQARFNSLITDKLAAGARDAFLRSGGLESNLDLIMVPGAFELPIALQNALPQYDGVVCIGAIIRGETPHFDYVASETAKGIASVSLKLNKPAAFGVLTTDTTSQAMERAGIKAGNKGFEAMSTLIETLSLLKRLEMKLLEDHK